MTVLRSPLFGPLRSPLRSPLALRKGGFDWYPGVLYQPGDILLWYDPSDLTTMFQDVAGTSPVTADGQSVLLMLDKGQWGGKTLAQVLAAQAAVLNVAFASYSDTAAMLADGWEDLSTAPATVTISGGAAVFNRPGSGTCRLAKSFATAAGKTYRVVTTGGAAWGVGTNSGADNLVTTSADLTKVFTATGTTSWMRYATVDDGVIAQTVVIKEIPGYHRVQATPSQAPKYKTDGTLHWLLYDGTDDGNVTPTINWDQVTSDGAARRNLLVNPTQLDHTTWAKAEATVTANAGAAPDGTTTADKLIPSVVSTASHTVEQSRSVTNGVPVTLSGYCKAGEYGFVMLQINAAGAGFAVFDLTAGTVVSTSLVTASIAAADNGFYRCSITGTPSETASRQMRFRAFDNGDGDAFSGDGTSGIFIWGAQLELGSTATAFQNIGSDEVAICAGITKSSDAAAGVFAELSASSSSNNGTFALFAPVSAAANYSWRSKGTVSTLPTASPYDAPTTNVLTGQGKIATDLSTFRADGAQVATSTGDQGTGNFGNYPLYFGRRGGSSLPFNGKEHQFVATSRLPSDANRAKLETFTAAKTGVIL